MHDDNFDADHMQKHDVAGKIKLERIVGLRRAAVFDDENFISKFTDIGQRGDDYFGGFALFYHKIPLKTLFYHSLVYVVLNFADKVFA